MRCLLRLATCLVPVLFVSQVDSQRACPSGWFGETCLLQCNCHDTHCSAQGDCNRNLCKQNYFGPRCQYLNLASMATGNARYLTDYDESTCNRDPHTTSLFFDFGKTIRFFWARVYLRSIETSRDLDVRLNSLIDSCVNKRLMLTETQTIDVRCDSDLQVRNITLKGKVVPNICTLEIGSGRNAALKQRVTQTSTDGISEASRAVDGDTSTVYCTRTQAEDQGPELTINFTFPHVLYKVVVINSGIEPQLLGGFHVISYDENRGQLERYTAPSTFQNATAEIDFFSNRPVKFLTVKGGSILEPSRRILSVCEVQAFGVTVCPEGLWGLECRNSCNCNPYESCDAINGVCNPECPNGFYGFQCQVPCPKNCRIGRCLARTGVCRRCVDGYLGITCDKFCPKGTHGTNCTKTCRPICEGDLCEPISGDCYKCKGPFVGAKCDVCRKGVYGKNCTSRCPENCLDGDCDLVTGNCARCKGQYLGPKCTELYQPPWLYLIIGIICFLLLMCCLLLLLRRRSRKPPAEEESKPLSPPPASEGTEAPQTDYGESDVDALSTTYYSETQATSV